jgi:hypothetical protein
MMKYDSTQRFESKAMPGVFVTVKILTDLARANLALATMEARAEMDEIQIEWLAATERMEELIPTEPPVVFDDEKNPTPEEMEQVAARAKRYDEALKGLPAENRKEYHRLKAKQAQCSDWFNSTSTSKIEPAWIRAGFVSCENLEIGDYPSPDAELLIGSGPPALTREIFIAIFSGARLTDTAIKNSPSPSSSAAVGAGEMNATTAPPVSSAPTT